ncbi:MAG: hypothetical protein QXG00_00500 [Candidatus Woesearchaeota archaeon]
MVRVKWCFIFTFWKKVEYLEAIIVSMSKQNFTYLHKYSYVIINDSFVEFYIIFADNIQII